MIQSPIMIYEMPPQNLVQLNLKTTDFEFFGRERTFKYLTIFI